MKLSFCTRCTCDAEREVGRWCRVISLAGQKGMALLRIVLYHFDMYHSRLQYTVRPVLHSVSS